MSTFRKIINLIYFLILVCLLVVLYSMAFDLEFMKTLVDAVRDNAGYTMLVNIGLVLVLGVTCLRAIYILFKKSYDCYVLKVDISFLLNIISIFIYKFTILV